MLNRTKKRELRERLERLETDGDAQTRILARIVLEILEETPTESEQADAVRKLLERGEGRHE